MAKTREQLLERLRLLRREQRKDTRRVVDRDAEIAQVQRELAALPRKTMRLAVAQTLHAYEVSRGDGTNITIPSEKLGPMGGTSGRFEFTALDVEGKAHRIAVNVYDITEQWRQQHPVESSVYEEEWFHI